MESGSTAPESGTEAGGLHRYAGLLILLTLTACVWNVYRFVDAHAVNVPYLDQLDYLAPYLEERGMLAIFTQQHGPHRQGLGMVLTALVADLTHLDLRVEAFLVAGLLVLATILALFVKRACSARFEPADALIPLIFLAPDLTEAITIVPNPAHGAMPLLLLTCCAWFLVRPPGPWRDPALVLLCFFCIFTGFALFAVAPMMLMFAGRRIRKHQQGRSAKPELICLSLCFAWVVLFLVDYTPSSAVEDFRFPAPNWPEYPLMMALALARFAMIEGPLALPLGLVLLLAITWLAGWSSVAWWRHCGVTAAASHHLVVAFLSLYTLLFLANMAVGRISLGLEAATGSRYTPLITPAFFALFLHISLVWKSGWPRRTCLAILGLLLLQGLVLPQTRREQYAAQFAQLKRGWRETYLDTEDVLRAQRQHPPGLLPKRHAAVWLKIQFFDARRLSFFRTHPVRARIDAALTGRWIESDPSAAEGTRRIHLGEDGQYLIAEGRRGQHKRNLGSWRAKDGRLEIRPEGGFDWFPLGPYQVQAQQLEVQMADGRVRTLRRDA